MFGPCSRPPARWAPVLLVIFAAAGCGDDGLERLPVAGKVLVDGQPLRGKAGSVLFKPDASKGNSHAHEVAGTITDEGGYELYTKGKKGAPAGWYKVVVFAAEKGADRDNVRQPFHARYNSEKTTPLAVEVVAGPAPDQYDLKLKKK